MRYPPFKPTDKQREQVRALAVAGINFDLMAELIINPATGKGISRKTLAMAFPQELKLSKAQVKGQVLAALINNAVRHNNVVAQIFLAKCLCGLSENGVPGWEEPDAALAPKRSRDDLAKLTPAELARRYREEMA